MRSRVLRVSAALLCAVLGGAGRTGDLQAGTGSANIPPRTAAGLPNIQSESSIVFDMDSGDVLYERRADEVRPIASTGKVLVALVARDLGVELDGETVITPVDHLLSRGGARTRLSVGYVYKNVDLLRAMLVASDNRAPSALGRAVGLDPDQLVENINDFAARIGLRKTFFTDPPGLRGNVSTAREMATAYRLAMKDDLLRSILSADQIEIHSLRPRQRAMRFFNTNRSLRSNRYVVTGGKTGYTDAARYCLLISAIIGKKHIGMVFLGAHYRLTRYGDFNRVVEWVEDGMPGGSSNGSLRATR